MNIQWKQYLSRPVVLMIVFLMMVVCMVGFTMRPRTMIVIADGKSYQVSTSAREAAQIVAQAQVRLGAADRLEVSQKELGEGTVIRVVRAVPVMLQVGTDTKEIWTAAETVAEAAVSGGYEASRYTTLIEPTTKVTQHMVIPVAAYEKKQVEADEVIPYQVMVRPDNRMLIAEEEVEVAGVSGLRHVVYDVIYVAGEPLRRIEVSSVIKKEPVSEVKRVGTRATVETSRGAIRFTKKLHMEATAYHPMDGDGSGITYSGTPARHGVVAVDPKVIPIGTRVYVPGYGEAIAADTGGAIIGNRIDLCMETYSECYAFGRRGVDVYILS